MLYNFAGGAEMRGSSYRWTLTLCLIVLASFVGRASAQTPSFDCHAAKTPAEVVICATPALATDDVNLAAAYKAAQSADDADHVTLKDEQLAWLRQRGLQCRPSDLSRPAADTAFIACLKTAYEERIAELAMTPQASAPCEDFIAALTAQLNAPFSDAKPIADIAAGLPGSPIIMDHVPGDDYILKSTYQGSLGCQNPYLFRKENGTEEGVPLPADFAPGEGAHCDGDQVRLVSINGVPGVLDEANFAGGQTTQIEIVLRENGHWSDECSVVVSTRPTYHVAVASYSAPRYAGLGKLAENYSNENHGLLTGRTLPSLNDLNAGQKQIYNSMLKIALDKELAAGYEVPFFGSNTDKIDVSGETGCQISFDGLGGELFPVLFDNQVLLGKIGNDGFGLGAHSGGPNDAIAIYRLTAGELQPIAGFCVVAGSQSIVSAALQKSLGPSAP